MTNPVRMALFMILATLFNIVVTAVSFFVLYLLYVLFLQRIAPGLFSTPESIRIGLTILFIAAIVIAFVIYRKAVKAFLKKYPMEESIEPKKQS